MNKFDKVPNELKTMPLWLTWQYVERQNGKLSKAPNATPSRWPANLGVFADVIKKTDDNNGIGIVIANDLVGIDIDNIDDNNIPENIQRLLNAGYDGYMEKSVSGHGYHIIGYCSNKALLLKLFSEYNNNNATCIRTDNVEIYLGNQFFTVSGNTISNKYGCIDNAIILAWRIATGKPLLSCIHINASTTTKKIQSNITIASYKSKRKDTAFIEQNEKLSISPEQKQILTLPGLDMNTVIKKMYEANPELKSVLEQGYSAVPDKWIDGLSDKSPSGIDMKIAGTLCHWLYRYGKNAIITLLEESAICRNEKNEKNKTYLINTVNKAYDSKKKFFHAVDFQKLNNKQKQEYKKLTEAINHKS